MAVLEFNIVKQWIADQAMFDLGKEYVLKQQMLTNTLQIKRELHRVKEAMQCIRLQGRLHINGAYNIQDSLVKASKERILSIQELWHIRMQSMACIDIKTYIQKEKSELLQELSDSLYYPEQLKKHIDHIIDDHLEIKDQASEHLYTIRQQLKESISKIDREIQKCIIEYRDYLMDTTISIHNDRRCLLVKSADKNHVKGFIHGKSSSGQAFYIEPTSLLNLNNQLQSLKNQEEDEITLLLKTLSLEVKEEIDVLAANMDTIAMVDGIFAKAFWGFVHDGCVASIVDTKQIILKEARHPLIDPKKVIANTYQLHDPYQMIFITGANTGGKTVTLKTIGLFVMMSQSGFPILASEASISIFNHIYVDLGDAQSIEASLSTFSAHISNLAYICNHANDKSLILLDEPGNGTDPKEGECLAIAMLEELRIKQAYVIVSTHFSELKLYTASKQDILLASVTFDTQTMKPTYHYVEGLSGQSNAFMIAKEYHLNERIVNRAIQLQESLKTTQEKALENLEKEIHHQKQKAQELQKWSESLELQAQAIVNEQQALRAQKELILTNAKEEASQILEKTKEETKILLKELQEQLHKPHVITQKIHELESQLEIEEQQTSPTHDFQVGDYVEIKEYHYFGDIIDIQKDRITVFTNGIKMNVKKSSLILATKQKEKQELVYQSRLKSTSVASELNVIGKTRVEAIAMIDKYLDSALLANMHQVNIIHGLGTGVLRKAVHQYLQHKKFVVSYEAAGAQNGGLGATIVHLK